jgi:hypothetical protein
VQREREQKNLLILADWRGDSGELQKTRTFAKANWEVAKMFHKRCAVVADMSQNAEFLFCFRFVSLVWTRPKKYV